MIDVPSSWKISLLRWVAWFVLCGVMCFEIFAIHEAAQIVMARVFAAQALAREKSGQLMNTADYEGVMQVYQLGLLFFLGILVVFLVVALEYYLRSGEKQGLALLLKRIGLAAVLELAVYLFTLAAPVIM